MDRWGTAAKRARGFGLVWGLVVMLVTFSIASLAVDYGRAQVVKTELQAGVDAAALAAVHAMATATPAQESSVGIAAALAMAADNSADGSPLAISSADVLIGNWDSSQTPSFSTARSPVNAAQVSGHRDAAHGNPVYLWLESIVGPASCDVRAVGVAKFTPPPSPYGMVGINSVNFASLGVLAKVVGNLVSNGDVTVGYPAGILVSVTHNAQSYNGYVSQGCLASIGGTTSSLTSALNFPGVILPQSDNNAAISSCLDGSNNFIATGYVSIPAGTYVVHNLNLLAGLDLQLQGPVVFYVTGAVNVAVSVNLLGSSTFTPSNFKVNVCSGGTVNFIANLLSPMCMDLYAPQSDIAINVAVTHFTGTLIGSTLTIAVPAASEFDEAVPPTPSATTSTVQ